MNYIENNPKSGRQHDLRSLGASWEWLWAEIRGELASCGTDDRRAQDLAGRILEIEEAILAAEPLGGAGAIVLLKVALAWAREEAAPEGIGDDWMLVERALGALTRHAIS